MPKPPTKAVTFLLTASLFAVIAITRDDPEATAFFWICAALFAFSGLLTTPKRPGMTQWRSHI